MARSLLSSSWYRVAGMRPRLSAHAQVHRQFFRGEPWYILQDHQSGGFHRLSPAANLMLCLMDGRRTMQEIWDTVCRRLRDAPPTQDEAINLLSQLHAADVLRGDIPPDLAELTERSREQARRGMMMRLKNPLALRFPLLDPDRFLEATVGLVRPLFTPLGFLAWLALIVTGIALAVMHGPAMAQDSFAQVLTAHNLAILFLTYPLLKLIHEMGHAYAVKAWGGEVHEFGVMLLVLMPVPYVDASASAAFPEKWRRAVVGGAGVMVELALAALAMIVWANAEPGLVRAIAFNVILIASVSTLLFNGNPLLRFDGYYVMADLIEIPNLGARANKYFFYVVQRYGFGVEELESPATHPSERKWLFGYAVLASLYRVVVVVGIAAFVATTFFAVGVLLAILAVVTSLVMPLLKGLRFLVRDTRLRARRGRALAVTGAALASIWALLFWVPLPYATVAQGVVFAPEEAALRARTDGIVAAVLTSPEARVGGGEPVVQLEDPSLDTRVAVLKAQLAESQLRLEAVRVSDRVQAQMFEQQTRHLRDRLALFDERRRDLVVSAPGPGTVILPNAPDLVGRYVRRGDLLGYVLAPAAPVVRVAIPQGAIDLVRNRRETVEVRFSSRLDEIRPGTVLREVPGAQRSLPSLALSTEGGGPIPLDPTAPQKMALEGWFMADVAVPESAGSTFVGERVHVRFDHGPEAIAWRLLREVRQVFLRRFGV